MNEFDIFLNEQLQDEDFRKEYEAMKPEFVIIQAMIDARKKVGFMPKENCDN
ncbi:MAG: hypothetical protein K2O60_01555 [Ruminococcus sp.]|nr:hypothetical protein [Ruminococcus sp.]